MWEASVSWKMEVSELLRCRHILLYSDLVRCTPILLYICNICKKCNVQFPLGWLRCSLMENACIFWLCIDKVPHRGWWCSLERRKLISQRVTDDHSRASDCAMTATQNCRLRRLKHSIIAFWFTLNLISHLINWRDQILSTCSQPYSFPWPAPSLPKLGPSPTCCECSLQ